MAITINNNAPWKQYTASAGQTAFAGTWRIEAAANIKLYQTLAGVSPDDTTDILVYPTDYTITGIGVGNSFTVTLVTPASLNDTITIVGDIDFSATYNFLTNQDFDPEDFNEIFSKFDRELKQVRMELRNLGVKYQNSEQVTSKDLRIPQLSANQSWRMNTLNTEIEAVELSPVSPGETWYGITSGINTYTVTITDFVGYVTGEKIHIKMGSTNTSASTINVNGLGGKNLYRSDGTALVSADLQAGTVYDFLYDGTNYLLIGSQRATESSVGLSQIATQAEVDAGTDDFKYVTSKKLDAHSKNIFYGITAGTPNNYTATISGIASYYAGLIILLKIHSANTGAATLNINGIGAISLLSQTGDALGTNDLAINELYLFVYNGTAFELTRIAKSSDTRLGLIRTCDAATTKAASDTTRALTTGNLIQHPGVAKAWVTFDGTGAILKSYNITSVTRTAPGAYNIVLAVTMADANYCVVGCDQSSPPTDGGSITLDNGVVMTATTFSIVTLNQAWTRTDKTKSFVAIYGELA